MVATLSGMVSVAIWQVLKAKSPIAVTDAGIVVALLPVRIVFVAVLTSALQLSRESYTAFSAATSIELRAPQWANARLPIDATSLPIVSVCIAEQ